MVKNLLVSIFILFAPVLVRAQEEPSSIKAKDKIFSHQYSYLNTDTYWFVDTSFNSLKWYRRLNATYKDDFGSQVLHNMGAPRNDIVSQMDFSLDNYFTLGPYQAYFSSQNEIPFYHTRSAFSEANYVSAINRGQAFSILHTQNINKRWNFLIRYRRLNSLGAYAGSQNIQSRFLFNTHYTSGKGKYEIYAYALSEKLDAFESGGLDNDSSFEENVDIPREALAMRFQGGQIEKRVIRNREFFVQQRYNLLNPLKQKKAAVDSLDSTVVERNSQLAFVHRLKYQRQSNTYGGFTNDVYTNYYFSTANYTDSVAFHSLDNRLVVLGEVGDSSKFEVEGGLRGYQMRYVNSYFDQGSFNLGITGRTRGTIKDLIEVEGALDYFFSGALTNDFSLRTKAGLKLWKEIRAEGGYNYLRKTPEFFTQQYISNNFIWYNNFEQTTSGELNLGLKWKRGHLNWTQRTTNNLVFFNESVLPEQVANVVRLSKIEVRQDFEFWKFVHLDNRVVLQEVTEGADFMPLPQWVTRNAIYFDFDLFDRALRCIVGAELNYFSAFSSPSYSAGTGRFYLANEKIIGDYPYLDLFAQFKIKSATIFLKYQHLNQGLNGYRYYAAPRYPMADRFLRVGISWRFFN
jgi:hypothetical protein